MKPLNGRLGNMQANPIDLDAQSHYPKVWHLPAWKANDDKARIAVLREIAMRGGRDPRIAALAVHILRSAGVQPRDYKGQAQALLKWVQNPQNMYYINEPSERLQDPVYSVKVGFGDCDDLAILLASLFESIRLEWRFCLSGKVRGKNARWIEGTPLPKHGKWVHIYLIVGYPPFKPKKWLYAEPTLSHAELGWDVIAAMKRGENFLPEMSGPETVAAPEERGIIQIVSPEVKEKEEKRKKLWERVKDRLTPENLATDVVIGAVTAILVGRMIDFIEDRFIK